MPAWISKEQRRRVPRSIGGKTINADLKPPHSEARNRPSVPEDVLQADAFDALQRLPAGCVDLIYIDPPFGTGQIRRLASIKTGAGTSTRKGFGDRLYQWQVQSVRSYRDDMSFDEYMDFLAKHLAQAHRVLGAAGSLYLHLDHHSIHHARLLMDEIFGAENFLNEIIWAYDYGGRPRDRWPKKHDNILWYAKGQTWIFNREDIDRIPYMAPGLVGPEKAARGKLPTDVWWMTIVPTNGRERAGYPTQKPERLLERIIRASSKPGDLVLDFFAGTGTTGVVAKRLGRRCLLVDNNPEAVRIARDRLQQVGPQSQSVFDPVD